MLLLWLVWSGSGSGLAAQGLQEPATVRIGVLGLFHPRRLLLTASTGALTLRRNDGEESTLPAGGTATLAVADSGLLLALPGEDAVVTRTLALPPSEFTLAVPGKLTRRYAGALRVEVRGGQLVPVIAMAPETAVASIVAAESLPGTPMEALEAQAVATRSYLLANLGRHARLGFDSCDTTHCEFLRGPPPAGSPAAQATRATAGQVLVWTSGGGSGDDAGAGAGGSPRLVAAMFSRTCGGETRRWPRPGDPGAYPFYAVRCEACRRAGKERAGNGAGLCQFGAAEMARRGSGYRRILAFFFPNTSLAALR